MSLIKQKKRWITPFVVIVRETNSHNGLELSLG